MAIKHNIVGRSIDQIRKKLSNVGLGREKNTKSGMIIRVSSPNRDKRDVGDLIDALKQAEREYNRTRKSLYDIYHDVELDDDYKSGTSKRKSAVNNLELIYEIDGNEDNDITEWIKSPNWRRFKAEIINTIFWGHSLFEFNFDSTKDFWELIPRKNVEPVDGQILQNENDYKGIPYRIEEFDMLSELFSEDHMGLLLFIGFPVIYKRNGVGDWALYQELAGNNFNIYKVSQTGTKSNFDIDKVIKNTGAGGYVTLPEGIDIDQQNNSSSSQNQLFKEFNRTQSNNIYKLILGQSSTTNDDEQGSYAKSQVSLFEQSQVHQDDQIYMLNYLNYNFNEFIPNWDEFSSIGQGEFKFKEPEDIVIDEEVEQIEETVEE